MEDDGFHCKTKHATACRVALAAPQRRLSAHHRRRRFADPFTAQISLAHFCEVHGPTSILSTQLSPLSCDTCQPCGTPLSEDQTRSSSHSYPPYWQSLPARLRAHQTTLSSPFESPPTSPTSSRGNHNPYFPSIPSDTDILSRFGSSYETECDACDNCTFLIPKDMSERLPEGAPGSPSKDGKGRHGSPVLRTSQAVLAKGSPIHDDDGDETDVGRPFAPRHPNFSSSLTPSPPSVSCSGASSPGYPPPNVHTHVLHYVTTRQPPSPAAYSLLRRSCIRTLSCENLPRGTPSGPIYFGDPIAGYTIAYIFRLPDPRARGKRRTYALIALGGRDSWRVSMAMVEITKVFESIAAQIIAMADHVLERESQSPQGMPRPPAANPITPPPSAPGSLPKNDSYQSLTTIGSTAAATRNLTHVSSFLSAKKVDPDGYPRVSREVMRAKGLSEIVGKESFFVELHAKFCMILSSLVKAFGK